MAAAPPSLRDALRRDVCLVAKTVQAGVVPSRAAKATKNWRHWETFCTQHHQDPWLGDLQDPVPLIQIYAQRLRDGRASTSGRPLQSKTVDDILCQVLQAFTLVGASDPGLDRTGHLDFRLQRQLRAWKKTDPPSARVHPITIPFLYHAYEQAKITNTPSAHATADMLCLAFYFLMRPGEYCDSRGDAHPFRLADVQLYSQTIALDIRLSTNATLLAATH